MKLDRIDLADIHDPQYLAEALHLQLGAIAPPIPVVEIANAIDITEVRVGPLDGIDGMLLTDTVRSRGAILANDRKGNRRARFTVAHELGHFLMERHVFTDARGFRCSGKDLRETRAVRQHYRQESEANCFAIELLVPASRVARHLSAVPDLRDSQRMRDDLDVSLEACVRRMIALRKERLAAVWSYQGQVRYPIRGSEFPFIPLSDGDRLPEASLAARAITNGKPGFTEFAETHAQAWTRRPELALYEQTRLTKDGHAVTLLWAEPPETDELGATELGKPEIR